MCFCHSTYFYAKIVPNLFLSLKLFSKSFLSRTLEGDIKPLREPALGEAGLLLRMQVFFIGPKMLFL